MYKSQGQDLFQLQTELVQMKVNMAVNNTIDRVMNGIADLKGEMVHVEQRLIAVETKLGMDNEIKKEMRANFNDTVKHVRHNFVDLLFKGATVLVSGYLLYQLHALT